MHRSVLSLQGRYLLLIGAFQHLVSSLLSTPRQRPAKTAGTVWCVLVIQLGPPLLTMHAAICHSIQFLCIEDHSEYSSAINIWQYEGQHTWIVRIEVVLSVLKLYYVVVNCPIHPQRGQQYHMQQNRATPQISHKRLLSEVYDSLAALAIMQSGCGVFPRWCLFWLYALLP